MVNKDEVMKILGTIEDPEIRRPLTELDMIKFVDIDGGKVKIGVTLTVAGCPLKGKISKDVKEGVEQLEGVESVEIEFDEMTPEQRTKLKQKLGQAEQDIMEAAKIACIAKRFIAISSGKGGVGKSTVTTNLASALAKLGYKVGLLDADVYGFSIPHMLGVNDIPKAKDNRIIPLQKGENIKVISMGFFIDESEPVIWRGPMLHKAITQFITDVEWGELDFLLMDLPPGTGDITITIAQAIPSAEVVVITTPQSTATNVAGRVGKMAEKTKLKVVGVIENMAYYESNGHRDYIFGQEGGKQLAQKMGVELLGEIPLMTSIREGSDNGHPVASEGSDREQKLFEDIAKRLAAINAG